MCEGDDHLAWKHPVSLEVCRSLRTVGGYDHFFSTRDPLKSTLFFILKDYGVPLKKFLGWCSNDEKQNEHTNKLQ